MSESKSGDLFVVFDGPPGPEAGRFVEVEDATGHSVSAGEWKKREDGYWTLRIPNAAAAPDSLEALKAGEEEAICGRRAAQGIRAGVDSCNCNQCDAARTMRAAIARAEGR